jgi:hypothetical protein
MTQVNFKKMANNGAVVPIKKNKNKKTLLFLLLAFSFIGSVSIIIIIGNSVFSFAIAPPPVYAVRATISPEGPIINDPNLVAQEEIS